MRNAIVLTLALVVLTLSSGLAAAQVDVEMAFDPTSASGGETVSFFVSVANLGDEAVVADIELTLSFGLMEFGPFLGQLPLAAGEELSCEIMMPVPMLPEGGDFTITATVTAGDYSDTATATLTILAGTTGTNDPAASEIADSILDGLSASAVPNAESSIGGIKSQYR